MSSEQNGAVSPNPFPVSRPQLDGSIILISPSPDSIQRRTTWSRSNQLDVIDLTNNSNTDIVDLTEAESNKPKCDCSNPNCGINNGTGTECSSLTSGQLDNSSAWFSTMTCPICLETLITTIQKGQKISSTICGHIFCEACILTAIKVGKRCPTCRRLLAERHVHPLFLHFST
uniref:E3 ubiquitin-protein ligase RNF4 n=1 Tax=Phallusia mammillata TaxID=59560 RepID=A0A6F9DRR4_9ASCI|nr:E3 ubiquitin-protein ligase RNF4 [Phallusia mammillata]